MTEDVYNNEPLDSVANNTQSIRYLEMTSHLAYPNMLSLSSHVL